MGSFKSKQLTIDNGSRLTIRRAEEADAEAYLQLEESIVAEQYFFLCEVDELTMTIDQQRHWLQSNNRNPQHLVLVAEIDALLVGQLNFSNGHRRRIAHTGEFAMAVNKAYRGQGIGHHLLGALVDWASNNPVIEKINLMVHHNNDIAINLYKSHGFAVEGRRVKDLKYGHNKYIDTLMMGLPVILKTATGPEEASYTRKAKPI